MKFVMFEKENKDKKYLSDPYRAFNFKTDEKGNLICSNWKKFALKYDKHILKSMKEQKNCMNVSVAKDVLTKKNVTKEK